jgi:hypothetical protein
MPASRLAEHPRPHSESPAVEYRLRQRHKKWGRANPGMRYNRSQVGVRGLYNDNEWTWRSVTGCPSVPSAAAALPLTTP